MIGAHGPAGGGDGERRRLEGIYARYAASPARRRRWSAADPGNIAIRDELVAAVWRLAGPELAGASAVLDVGCGGGWWLARLAADARCHADLHGVDMLAGRVAAARAAVPRATIADGDAGALPFPAGRFDVVTMFTVLSSLPDAAAAHHAVGEARRVLTPGGVLLLWEPRLPNPGNRATIVISRGLLKRALTGTAVQTQTTTLVPAVARRLGRHAERWYPRLTRLPALRTHRLTCARAPVAR
jgi:ubiquinone/menaquinone biosynthesis C-methylase UbiE